MSKTIKVIDFINKMAQDYNYRPTVKFHDITYKYYDCDYKNDKNDKYGVLAGWCLNLILDDTVQIIEEEPEIDIQSYKELLLDQLREREHTNADIYMLGVQINALIKAVKQLDNQINNK
jgi:hypothetical protein